MNYIRGFFHRWLDSEAIRSRDGAGIVARLASVLHSEYRWRKVRNEFAKQYPNCSVCGASKELEVHHIRPWSLFPDRRYDFSNLISLCDPCHFRFGHWRNWKKWNPKINGFSEMAPRFLDDIRDEADQD